MTDDQGPTTNDRSYGTYRLLDTGGERRLEQVGPLRVVRQGLAALWPPRLPAAEWDRADAVHHRSDKGGGRWEWRTGEPREFPIEYGGSRFWIRLTDFGHLGLFPEQAENWAWLRRTLRTMGGPEPPKVLNLFAYTGGSSLAASRGGAAVVHVDAARGVVDWARENARLSGVADRPIRWIVDDALKFVRREARRGNRYQGIVLDPPTFGRGPKGQVFKIEEHLFELLEACAAILAPGPAFVLLSCHTPGFTPTTLANLLEAAIPRAADRIERGEMLVTDETGRALPSGTYARWVAGVGGQRTGDRS
ncbi:class I SAM-dependent methyltransferase [Deferrisoma palaeochoriense]